MAKQGQADRFHQGTMTDGWRWFGAHPAKKRGRDGWTFRVWAPHAEAVSVVGDFNDWEEGAAPLARKGEIWEGFLPDLPVYTSYKYAVRGADGQVRVPDPVVQDVPAVLEKERISAAHGGPSSGFDFFLVQQSIANPAGKLNPAVGRGPPNRRDFSASRL